MSDTVIDDVDTAAVSGAAIRRIGGRLATGDVDPEMQRLAGRLLQKAGARMAEEGTAPRTEQKGDHATTTDHTTTDDTMSNTEFKFDSGLRESLGIAQKGHTGELSADAREVRERIENEADDFAEAWELLIDEAANGDLPTEEAVALLERLRPDDGEDDDDGLSAVEGDPETDHPDELKGDRDTDGVEQKSGGAHLRESLGLTSGADDDAGKGLRAALGRVPLIPGDRRRYSD